MRRFLKGFAYAGQGIWFCIRHERNFRIHMAAAVYVLLFAPYFSFTRGEWAALLLTLGLVVGAEAFNTAIEQAVNILSPERRREARAAKDAAAGAVLLCAVAAVGVGIVLFVRAEGWAAVLSDFRLHIWKPAALVLSLPAALWFIVTGGRRKKPRGPADKQ